MKNYNCIKCNSNEIFIFTDKTRYNNALGISSFKIILTTKYICCDCGYFEEYITSKEELNFLKNLRKTI